MKVQNTIWFLLILVICLVCCPTLANAAQQKNGQPTSVSQPENIQNHLSPDERDAQRSIPGAYRLIYTMTEMDGTKFVGSQKYELIVDLDGLATNLKIGTKIPIAATNEAGANITTYIDLGLNIHALLHQYANGLQLTSRLEQSALEPGQATSQNPVIRQTSIESTVLLNENKSVNLSQLDIPGSTQSIRIAVEVKRVQ